MKKTFRALITDGCEMYSSVEIIAENESQAREYVEQHLAEKKPLGFNERGMRKKNPKRAKWKPGLMFITFIGQHEAKKEDMLGVVCD